MVFFLKLILRILRVLCVGVWPEKTWLVWRRFLDTVRGLFAKDTPSLASIERYDSYKNSKIC